MKPHIQRFWHKGYIPKWECIGGWKRGTGYTPSDAYNKWTRCPPC